MIKITSRQAYEIGNAIGVAWCFVELKHFRLSIIEELEPGLRDPQTNVINDDLCLSSELIQTLDTSEIMVRNPESNSCCGN